jgi:hypothetical protein
MSSLSAEELQKLVLTCHASKDPEKAGTLVARTLKKLAHEYSTTKRDTHADTGHTHAWPLLKAAVMLASIGHSLHASLTRRNVPTDEVLRVFARFPNSTLNTLDKLLREGAREQLREQLAKMLKDVGNDDRDQDDDHVSTFNFGGKGGALTKNLGDLLDKAQDMVEDLLDDGDNTDDLVDALERVTDENVLDEAELVQMVCDLREAPQVVAKFRTLCEPRKWWEQWKWWDRRDTFGQLEKQARQELADAVPWLKPSQVTEVVELIAADQAAGAEPILRMTGVAERCDNFVADLAKGGGDSLLIGHSYLMLMMHKRTLSPQGVRSVVEGLDGAGVKAWLKDLYGKDAIDLRKSEGGDKGVRVFGLFRLRQKDKKTGKKTPVVVGLWWTLEDCLPVWLVGTYSLWPMITEKLLTFLRCTAYTLADKKLHQMWSFDSGVECYTADHSPTFQIALIGLFVWSIGTLAFILYKINAAGDENRYNDENMRKYGYFFQGFEPQYWYWEIGVKRFDFLLVAIVTHTSLIPDPKAKIVMYVMIGGLMFAAHMYAQPYDDRQHGLLDRCESVALLVRFSTFASIAALLLLAAGSTTALVMMGVLFMFNMFYVFYVLLHIGSEVTKKNFTPAVGNDPDEAEEMKKKVAAAAAEMGLVRRIGFKAAMCFLIPWHRQRVVAEKCAVHMEWQGPFRNARFGKLPPPPQSWSRQLMLGFVKSMMSLGDDAEVGNIVKQIGDFYGYIMAR